MRCLVTGASGHVGAAVVRQLLESGEEVFALVRQTSDLRGLADVIDRVELLRGDLGDLSRVQARIGEIRPEAVVHTAWEGVTRERRNSPDQLTRNIAGCMELFRAIADTGCECWIGIGSQAEYGAISGILTEESAVAPVTPYGYAKLAVSTVARSACQAMGMRFVWLRLLATYGPNDDEAHLIPGLIRSLSAGETPALTPGEQIWDYLFVDDAAEAIGALLRAPAAEGVFVLGSGEATTVRSLAERVRDLVRPGAPLDFGSLPYGENTTMHLQADVTRLTSATGWSARTTLEDGLRRTVEWYRERPARHTKE